MRSIRNSTTCLVILAAAALSPGCGAAHAEIGRKVHLPVSETPKSYPKIVIYSISGCSHCRAVKEYLDARKIPYINRDVEQDEDALDMLVNRYDTTGVPLVVIGDDDAIIRGFDPTAMEEALRGARSENETLRRGER